MQLQQQSPDFPITLFPIFYSVLKLFTGFATAAFIAWKLTVINAINITNTPPDANNHQLNEMRYG
jgi:hypothetical protein